MKKKFIYKSFFFFSSLLFISLITFFLLYYKQKKTANKQLKKISNFECLLMGDSQIQRINNNSFDFKTYNFASSGEHYYFTYQKLLNILETNYRVKRVVLGVSIHNFSPMYNRLFDMSFSEGQTSFKRFLFFLNDGTFIKYKNLNLKSILIALYKGPYWGGFEESKHKIDDLKIIDKSIKMHFELKGNEREHSYSQRKYLFLIDSLCRVKKIKLFICATPYLNGYKNKIPKKYVHFYDNTINSLFLKSRYNLNFLKDTISQKFMSDGNHLNFLGSKIYSRKINKLIK